MDKKETFDIIALSCLQDDIAAELAGAKAKFPNDAQNMVALVEEVGELAKALLEAGNVNGQTAYHGFHVVYAEAVQVAAMAMKIALFGDGCSRYRWTQTSAELFRPTKV